MMLLALICAAAPLVQVADVPLPGKATRFDYQDVDVKRGHLVVAHMGDSEVLVLNLSDGSVAGRVKGVDTVRGIAVAGADNRIWATAKSGHVVGIDATTLTEVSRWATGSKPDGVAYDAAHGVLATSDQGDGALSLFSKAGKRTAVALGKETGNVIYDEPRGLFWVTVPEDLVSVEPATGKVKQRLPLKGCAGAHGLRLHPDGKGALVACEDNDLVVRVDLETGAVVSAPVGKGPDVLAVDPELERLYVSAESGDLTVFDLARAGLVVLDREHVADNAHTVAVDPATHRVFFPLQAGPVLRVMKP